MDLNQKDKKTGSSTKYITETVQARGKKNYQQDRYVELEFTVKDYEYRMYAVYDGHGGSTTSDFLKNHFHEILAKTLEKKPPHEQKDPKNRHLLVKAGMIKAMKSAEEQVLGIPDLSDGSTAVICLFVGDTVTTANVGDSRAILARMPKNLQGMPKAIQLSKDHTAGEEDEIRRIRKGGGIVSEGRIHLPKVEKELTISTGDYMQNVTVVEERSLEVSRSFGDPSFKGDGTGVVMVPHISKFKINSERDKFLIIACDGLFEVWNNQQVVDFVYKKLYNDPTKPDIKEVMKALLKETVIFRHAKDNVTITLIILNK